MLRLTLIALAVLAAAVTVVTTGVRGTSAAFTDSETIEIGVSTGSVGIDRDGDGLVFSSAPLAPGDTARATVKVSNGGSLPIDMALARENQRSDAPNGCAVRDALGLKVVEVAGTERRTLVDGPLKSVAGSLALGAFAPGEERTYEVAVTFAPQHGATALDNDNCFQGSVDTERFSWQAVEARS